MSTNNVDFSIIIVNYNSAQLLLHAINSWRASHTHSQVSYEFIVADNNSSSIQQEQLKKSLADNQSNVQLYFLGENLGFARANNIAATHSQAHYLVFLNPDTICTQNLLDASLSVLSQADVGLVGPRLLLSDGGEQAYAHGPFPTLATIYQDKILHQSPPTPTTSSSPQVVDWLSGACLMISRANFVRLGGFSSDYFMYFEDVDLCHKAVQAGLRNYLLTDISLTHLGGEKKTLSYQRRRDYFHSQARYFQRWRKREYIPLLVLRAPYQLYCYLHDQP